MKEYCLNYITNFRCIADKCKHTCCAGWEISIDERSLDEYKLEQSTYSVALKKGINFKRRKFKTDKRRRCAFLNENGLCEIILNLGENRLCQVCRDHPRFRSFFDDRTETGLGFCCEEATRIILSFKGKIEPVLVFNNDVQEEIDFNQKNILEFRNNVLNVIQDRNVFINERVKKILKMCKVNIGSHEFNKVLKTFLSFERIDRSWTKKLKSIDEPSCKQIDEKYSLFCEQFLINSAYRHLSDAEDTLWVRARMVACIVSWFIIESIIEKTKRDEQELFELVVDVVRAYSAEVEYSQKNLNKLYSTCYKFINL